MIALKVRRRSGNTTQNLLFTTKYHNKQLEITTKQNPDACDCVWIDGWLQSKTWKYGWWQL